MRAVQLDRPGGPEALTVTDLPSPKPGPGEVLLATEAAGVTFADTLIRAGAFGDPDGYPTVLGREVAGRVVDRGPGVDEPADGTRVAAMVNSGGYAERVTAPVGSLVALGETVTPDEALAALGSGLTAQGILEAAPVRAGDRVLVTAAAGGVGSLAVQLARIRGATVVGLASTDAKRDLVRQLGAADAVDSSSPDWVDAALAAAGGAIDVVLDSVGGPVLGAAPRLLAPHGRHVLYGFASGDLGQLGGAQLGALVGGNHALIGFNLAGHLDTDPPVSQRLRGLVEMIADRSLRVVTTGGFSLDDVAAAHRAVGERETAGKVVLSIA